MKHLLISLLALALIAPASAALANHGADDALPEDAHHDESHPEDPKLPPPPGTVFKQNQQERKDLLIQNQQDRKELFEENQQERKDFRGQFGTSTRPAPGTPGFASSTRGLVGERKEMLFENIQERRALFASTTSARIELAKENREERRAVFASTTALKKAQFTEEMKARILSHAEGAGQLLEAMLGRLAGIAERIATRIEEVAATGADTADAEAELAEAYDAIDAADAAIAEVKTKMEEALASETPREMLPEAKTAAEAAKAALRAAHQALMEAAQALPKPPAPSAETPNE